LVLSLQQTRLTLSCPVAKIFFVTAAAARGDYNELEQLVAGQLAGLARDASWLKSYLVASLLLGKEAMQVRCCAAVVFE
jgi:hypothetical protein